MAPPRYRARHEPTPCEPHQHQPEHQAPPPTKKGKNPHKSPLYDYPTKGRHIGGGFSEEKNKERKKQRKKILAFIDPCGMCEASMARASQAQASNHQSPLPLFY